MYEMEIDTRQARLLLMQDARQRYIDAVNRHAPAEVIRHYLDIYNLAFDHYAAAVIEESAWGHYRTEVTISGFKRPNIRQGHNKENCK